MSQSPPNPPTPNNTPSGGSRGPKWYGDYYLLDQIGRGGMAEVFRAVRTGPEGFLRTFVIKRITPAHAGSQEFVQMFCEEARISAMLNHPNIVQVYDFGQIDGTYFLAMEYLRGKDLLTVLRALRDRGTRMPSAVAAFIAQQVATGLAYAHGIKGRDGQALRLVHRDISPANVMLLKAGGVKVLDFGIAKSAAGNRTQTQAGFVKGKLAYLSPEQARCEPLDGRSDVFSLGVTLWEALTMKPLFRRGSDYQTVRSVLEQPIVPPSQEAPGVPAALDAIVLRALERDRKRRYQSAKDLASDLAAHLREVRFDEDELVALLRDIYGELSSQVIPIFRGAESGGGSGAPAEADRRRHPSGMPTRALTAADATPEVPDTAVQNAADVIAFAAPRPRHAESEIAPTLEDVQVLADEPPAAEAATHPRTTASVASTSTPEPPPRPGRARAFGVVTALVLVTGGAAAAWVLPALRELDAGRAFDAKASPTVRVSLESHPPGAEVRDARGELLGVTPTVMTLPRAAKTVRLVASKADHQTVAHDVLTEHDSYALLDLPAARR